MVDKKYVSELAQKLFFELSDEQLDLVQKEIVDLENQLDLYKKEIDSKSIPANFPRVKNCATLRKDVVEQTEGDYLSNAKVVNKYVVGK